MLAEIPESFRDLLAGPVNVVLTTVMPDGRPQTTPIWCNLDGDDMLINTMKQFRKYKNIRQNPLVTLLAYRLDQPFRNIEVRGRDVLINTTLERQKAQNMLANPKANVLVIDPQNGGRFLEVRGEAAEVTQEGALAHADKQTRLYSNGKQQRFYGDIYPAEQQEKETRVIVKIAPHKITTDAAFS